MNIALDSTYSVGADLSGVGVYSREMLGGLARAHPGDRFAFCYRPASREVVAVSTATMVSWYEPTFRWFAHAAMVQIVQAERWADVLAAELEAETAVSAHPGSGPRPEPDEMLDWLGYTWSRPEWVIGSDELAPLVEPLAAIL